MAYTSPKYYVSKFEKIWVRVPFKIYEWAKCTGFFSTKMTRFSIDYTTVWGITATRWAIVIQLGDNRIIIPLRKVNK